MAQEKRKDRVRVLRFKNVYLMLRVANFLSYRIYHEVLFHLKIVICSTLNKVICFYRHNNYLQECTGFHEPTFHSTVHDLKILLLRFAQEKSFSDEAGGGGRISNIYLFPYTAHVALYVLNT